ncbi:hypothetical protein B0H19DRAFT_1072453 [Mycena capillaripes]|nr:hypothetical protein B0H19DRAFT_1072453 [Mycena capillaripes]
MYYILVMKTSQFGQYDGEPNPNESPDLATLLEESEEQEAQGVRVGALRTNYYSMWIPEPFEPIESDESPEIETPAHPILVPQVASPGPHTEWTAEREDTQAHERAAINTSGGHAELLAAFESRVGDASLSLAQSLNLESIATIGAEEHARATWRSLIPIRPMLRIGLTPELLCTTAADLELQDSLTYDLELTRRYQQDLEDILASRLTTREEIERMTALPTGTDSHVGGNLAIAAALNQRLAQDLDWHIDHVDGRLQLMRAFHRLIQAELTRQMLEREAYALQMSSGASSSPASRAAENFSLAVSVDNLAPAASGPALAVPTPSTPPPPVGSTPPPSYPETPESAGDSVGSEELWSVQEDLDDVVSLTGFLPGNAPIPIESDSEALYPSRTTPASPLLGTAWTRAACWCPIRTYITTPLHGSSPSLDDGVDCDPVGLEALCMISRAVYRMGNVGAEHIITYLRADGSVFIVNAPLPDNHLSDEFRAHHEGAMEATIAACAEELCVPRDVVRRVMTMDARNNFSLGEEVLRHQHGFLNGEPCLLPGTNYHDCVASLGPKYDAEDAYPGFRIQVLTCQLDPTPAVEHISNIRRPEKLVGLFDQPKRSRPKMLSIGSSTAYMLFDSGSNTDSLMPEYAHFIGSPRIKLDEQVVLQLGCVGSRSKISYGMRVAIDLEVNLDRYNGIIGIPFMNRHGIILDFARRQIWFPNGKSVQALTTLEEASVLTQHRETPCPAPIAAPALSN